MSSAERGPYERALEHAESDYARGDRARARAQLEEIIKGPMCDADDVDEIRAKELAIYRLGELLSAERDGDALIALLSAVRPLFTLLPKAKTTKLVRRLFEHIITSGVPLAQQHAVCLETISWAREEKRTFLRHRLQLRLVEVQFDEKDTRGALATLLSLLREVRRLDDRTLLLEVYLLESKIYYAIRNTSKARAALVSARTTANSIYCPPLAQAEIDLQSGVLHAEEHDHKTAYSYLYEAFEGFHQLGDQAVQARRALRYMILAKIATDSPDELATVLSSKSVLEYKGPDMDALRGIAQAYNQQDTHVFNAILQAQREEGVNGLLHDDVVVRQLEEMYDALIERHLLKVIAPYNRVQLTYLADLLKLPTVVVEQRISQLILDKKLAGIVDQQHNCLIVFDDVEESGGGAAGQKDAFFENAADAFNAQATTTTTLYEDALTALESYDKLVTTLFDKVSGKFDSLVEENLAKRKAKPGAAATKDKNNAKRSDEGAAEGGAGKKKSNAKDQDGGVGKP